MTRKHPVYSVLELDARGIARDHVALATIALSLLGTLTITALGLFQGHAPGWTRWFPFLIAASLLGSPGGYGFLFGMLLVDENDSGVRQALAVSPLRPTLLVLTRTAIATVWMCIWPLTSIYVMNSTWRASDIPFQQWLAVVLPLSLLTPGLALIIPTLAADKVGALAVFKGLTFITLIPLGLYFVPEGAWYRPIFLASPTSWTVEAYQAFLNQRPASGYVWTLGGSVYAVSLLAVAARAFWRKVYRLGY